MPVYIKENIESERTLFNFLTNVPGLIMYNASDQYSSYNYVWAGKKKLSNKITS